MGQAYSTLSTIATFVTYPVRASWNKAFGTNPNADVNITNSNINEFNSTFGDFEEKINYLINHLYQNINSSIRTFNANILFPHTQLLADNLLNHNNSDITGEFSMQRESFLLILQKIMLLYTTQNIGYEPNTNNNFKEYFISSYGIIKNRLDRISTTYNNIQPFLNQNNNESIAEFTTLIDAHFNDNFLGQNSIIQYLRLLREMTDRFVQQLDDEIAFFRQENVTAFTSQWWYNYSAGFFSWLARSGYSYRGTANFYTYFRDNNIILLRNQIDNKIQLITNANQILTIINRNIENLNCHILRNVTDVFSITFHVGNQNYTSRINLGNYIIQNYEVLCNLITTNINTKLQEDHPNVNNIQFNITYYQDQDPRFLNHVVIISNQRFTLNKNSSIMRILGWNSFIDVQSNIQLNNNQEQIGNFLMAPRVILNAEIGNIINHSARHNTIITNINNFNTNMDIQHTQEPQEGN